MAQISFDFITSLSVLHRRVLATVKEKKRISRTDLAKTLSVSMPTITRVIKHLIELGIIVETTKGKSRGGRSPVILEINVKTGFIIAVDFECMTIKAGAYNFGGDCVFSIHTPVRQKSYFETLYATIDSCLKFSDENGATPLCISIGVHGRLDDNTGTILYSSSFGWKNIPLRKILYEHYGLPTIVTLNTLLTAYGEWYIDRHREIGINNIVLINIGWGIGSSAIMNGRVIRGMGSAGEVGLTLTGIKNKHGGFFTLEQLAGGQRLVELAQYRWDDPRNRYLREMMHDNSDSIIAEDVIQAINANDPFANELLDEVVPYIGIAVSNLLRLYDPEVILMGGLLAELGSRLLNPIKEFVHSNILMEHMGEKEIRFSELNDNTCLIGATYIAFDQMLSLPQTWEA